MMIISLINQALFITGFVGIMMLVIEYLNVLTKGNWQLQLGSNRFLQYLIAVILGAIPGCLGPFSVVALYSHGVVSLGALVGAMIATSGDESFVMLAMFPKTMLQLTGILMIIGLIAGWLVDFFVNKNRNLSSKVCDEMTYHEDVACNCFPKDEILNQLKLLSLPRGVLIGFLGLFLFGVVSGTVGPEKWGWIRITLVISATIGLFIVTTVPDHFLKEHLWRHIVKEHLKRVVLWTFGALLFTELIISYFQLDSLIESNTLSMVIISALIGVIPESGPHLMFTTLFAQGVIPFVVLLTNSIVQDGHGMLPLLAHSRKQFIAVKIINLAIGLTVGLLVYFMGILNL